MVTITINIISTTAIIMGWVDKNKNPTLKWTILLATEAFRIRHKAVQIKHLHLRALGDYTNVSIRPGMRDGEGLVVHWRGLCPLLKAYKQIILKFQC